MGMTSRKFPRVPVNVPCVIEVEGVSHTCRMVQLGQGGALLHLPPSHPLSDTFLISFSLPNQRTIRARVEPRHRRERGSYRPDPSLPTVGCSFLELPDWAVASLAKFVTTQQEAIRQLQFSLALMPPSPKARELMQKVGVSHDLPANQLREFIRWSSSAAA